MIKIAPSVLACNFGRMADELIAMELAGADMIHLDVMDGHFVPNISFGPPVISSLRSKSNLLFDTHLMISQPHRYVEDFVRAGADLITIHIECDSNIPETLMKIRSLGVMAALSVKPETPVERLFPYLRYLSMVLVMTVEPGFGGQSFMEDICPKITELRARANALDLPLDIQVDGGIDERTAPLVTRAGANVLVAGSSLFGADNYSKAVAGLRAAGESALTDI